MNAYKEEAGNLRQDIDKLLNGLMEKNEDAMQEVQPDLIEDYRTLKSHISEQKDENEALYKQLLSLKKETQSSAQKIALFRQKIERLEQTIGVTKYNEDLLNNSVGGAGGNAVYKGSVFQTHTAGFDDEEDDEQYNTTVGHGNGLNTSLPTVENEDLLEDGGLE